MLEPVTVMIEEIIGLMTDGGVGVGATDAMIKKK